MKSGQWSLVTRITWWLTAACAVPFCVTAVVGGAFLETAGVREVRLLAHEELEEVAAILHYRADPVSDLPAVAAEVGRDHQDTPMAWRLRDRRTDAILGACGDGGLFTATGRGIATEALPVREGLDLEIVVDGTSLLAFAKRFWWIAFAVCGLGIAMGFLASRFIARAVGTLLGRVAAGFRPTSPVPFAAGAGHEEMPRELHGVVTALQEELDSIRREAERVRLFTTGLAHELRSPIQNLVGQAEVALLRERTPGHYRATLEDQLQELHNLSSAVDNVLGLCTAKDARAHAEHEEFDLAAEIGIRLSRERKCAERSGVDLCFAMRGDLRMAGDREAVLRGVRNAVANAVDWSPPGGRACLTVEQVGDEIVVQVDDAGPGIPVEERERVFDPFYRGPQRDRRRVGYGIGLALTREMAGAHQGSVRIDDSPFGGTRVTMRLARRAH